MHSLVQVGELIAGKYRLEHKIGSGGMGVVYAATHVQLEQRVALKFLFDDAARDPELLARFWREARAVVRIQSEHVARVMDIGELPGGAPYIVMEYLEGDDLENVVKRGGPLPVADAVRFLLQACEALAEVHAQGIVHRDIKPANLFLAARPDGTTLVKLLDFGISKAAPVWASDSLTNTRAVIGSPRYMSPEQLRSSRDVDQRADVWALGVTLFELLGGASPFARGTMPEVCASILKDEPLSLTELRPGLPPGLESVIRRCLAKEPEGRYRNVAELAIALRPFGPHGIIDISIERIVGVIQMAMLATSTAAPAGCANDPPTQQISAEQVEQAVKQAAQLAAPEPARSRTPVQPIRKSQPPQFRRDEDVERDYSQRIGPRNQIPRLAMDPAAITALALDHRAGFLLALIDGRSTLDEIFDISGMPRRETMRLVVQLLDHGVLVLTSHAR
jgi:eukaryotic-like serine/threonine-protein kinase